MKQVAPLRYDVIFKKAFSVPEIFNAFVRDILNIEFDISIVETDKTYTPTIGNVAAKFDLYAQDEKNRIIVNMQHVRNPDIYHKFLHHHCAALLEQPVKPRYFHPNLKIFTLVILTSGDEHKKDISVMDFDPKDLQGNPIGEIDHKIIYICPKYLNKELTPSKYHQWMEAIEDTLDEEVEESKYTLPAIQRVFNMIEKDQVTPEERARMFDEYGEEEIKKQGFEDGLKEGKQEGITQNIHDTVLRMHKKGLDIKMIAEIAGITEQDVELYVINN